MVLLLSHWFATIRIAEAGEELMLASQSSGASQQCKVLSAAPREAPQDGFLSSQVLHIKFIQARNGPLPYILDQLQ